MSRTVLKLSEKAASLVVSNIVEKANFYATAKDIGFKVPDGIVDEFQFECERRGLDPNIVAAELLVFFRNNLEE